MINKIRNSLTVKIFLLMSFLLLTVSGVTYAAVSGFLPVFYSSELESGLEQVSQEFAEVVGSYDSIEGATDAIELFEAGAQASVVILDQKGNRVWPEYSEEISEVVIEQNAIARPEAWNGEDEENAEYTAEAVEDEMQQTREERIWIDDASSEETSVCLFTDEEFGGDTGSSAVKYFDIEIGKTPYRMMVLGSMQQVDQAMGILKQIFPYITGIAVVLAVLFAAVGSFYLTAPTIRLSRISRKMAVLDFSNTYRGRRTDELGVLGRNLNIMAASLSATLADLKSANEKLRSDIEVERDLERRRIEFFSAVSHELKTPVTILKGHLLGMIQGVGAYQDRDRYLRRALDATESMENMVGELLTIARMECGTGGYIKKTRMDLSEKVREQIAQMTEMAEERGLAWDVEFPEHLYMWANQGMMEKVFRNLLVNAIRYTPPNAGNVIRVRLWAEKKDTEHSVAAAFPDSLTAENERSKNETAENRTVENNIVENKIIENNIEKNNIEKDNSTAEDVCCSIENTGVQIPAEDLPHLFEAFYRVEGSRSRRTGGSGLGLYIVRMALEQHCGECAAENTENGVRVSFRLHGQ